MQFTLLDRLLAPVETEVTERTTLVGGSVKQQLRRCHCHVLLIDPTTASTTTTPSARPGPAVRPSPGGEACDARSDPLSARSVVDDRLSVRRRLCVRIPTIDRRRRWPVTTWESINKPQCDSAPDLSSCGRWQRASLFIGKKQQHWL